MAVWGCISCVYVTNFPACVGSALCHTQSSPLSHLYYVNDTFHITIETVVQLPDSSSNAYTNYSNIEDKLAKYLSSDQNFKYIS